MSIKFRITSSTGMGSPFDSKQLPYKFYVLVQIGLSRRSSLIRVYAVCHSISMFWMH